MVCKWQTKRWDTNRVSHQVGKPDEQPQFPLHSLSCALNAETASWSHTHFLPTARDFPPHLYHPLKYNLPKLHTLQLTNRMDVHKYVILLFTLSLTAMIASASSRIVFSPYRLRLVQPPTDEDSGTRTNQHREKVFPSFRKQGTDAVRFPRSVLDQQSNSRSRHQFPWVSDRRPVLEHFVQIRCNI